MAKLNGTTWTVYDTANSGLPQDIVRTITVDDSGNAWIGTSRGGLTKFDGTNWIVYDTSNSDIPGDYVNSITIDSVGNKWIGVLWHGLAVFNDTDWTVYDHSNSGMPGNSALAVAIDQYGNKWIGSGSGLAVYKKDGITPVIKGKEQKSKVKFQIKAFQNTSVIRVSYTVTEPYNVILKLFDIKGRVLKTVVNRDQKAGNHQITFNCRDISNGAYFVHLQVGERAVTEKIMILK
jgi:ligand-binding sensor domain-containing protein